MIRKNINLKFAQCEMIVFNESDSIIFNGKYWIVNNEYIIDRRSSVHPFIEDDGMIAFVRSKEKFEKDEKKMFKDFLYTFSPSLKCPRMATFHIDDKYLVENFPLAGIIFFLDQI